MSLVFIFAWRAALQQRRGSRLAFLGCAKLRHIPGSPLSPLSPPRPPALRGSWLSWSEAALPWCSPAKSQGGMSAHVLPARRLPAARDSDCRGCSASRSGWGFPWWEQGDHQVSLLSLRIFPPPRSSRGRRTQIFHPATKSCLRNIFRFFS